MEWGERVEREGERVEREGEVLGVMQLGLKKGGKELGAYEMEIGGKLEWREEGLSGEGRKVWEK